LSCLQELHCSGNRPYCQDKEKFTAESLAALYSPADTQDSIIHLPLLPPENDISFDHRSPSSSIIRSTIHIPHPHTPARSFTLALNIQRPSEPTTCTQAYHPNVSKSCIPPATAAAAQTYATIQSARALATRGLASTTAYPARWSIFPPDTDAASVATESGTSPPTAGGTKAGRQMHPGPEREPPDEPLILLGMDLVMSLHKTTWKEAGRGAELQPEHQLFIQTTASRTPAVALTASAMLKSEDALWPLLVIATIVSLRDNHQLYLPALPVSLHVAPGAPAFTTPGRRTATSHRPEGSRRQSSPLMSLPAPSLTPSPTTTRE
jgi:hypothetical protein